MLDLKEIFHHRDTLERVAQQKGFTFDAPQFQRSFEARKTLLQTVEQAKAQKKQLSQEFHKSTQKGDVASQKKLQAKLSTLNRELKSQEARLRSLEEALKQQQLCVPNFFDAQVPYGTDELDNVPFFFWGTPKPPQETPLDHLQLAAKLQLADIESGRQIAGARSYVLTGRGAELEAAVHQFCADLLRKKGFQRQRVPTLVRKEALLGTGYLPLGAEEAYQLEDGKLWLAGTAEVGLMSAFRSRTLLPSSLPFHHFAVSACFRREAGSYGKDTKGFYRVHEFLKTENVILCAPEEEEQKRCFEFLLDCIKEIVQSLELPFRLVQCCSGELGLGQYAKVDCETWMPSRNAYAETHSCSSFRDYQTRRLNCRLQGASKKFPYSLNTTAAATPRLLIPLLEHHQTPEGTVELPQALHPYLGYTRIS